MTAVKVLLFIVAVFVLLWLLRGTFSRLRGPRAEQRPAAKGGAQPMLVCAHCGLHLPRDEALPGKGGVFCGEPHRAAYEKARTEAS